MNKIQLVFATNNINKLKEVRALLPDFIELLSLSDINCFEDIPETATTLEGNAILKADFVTRKFKLNCFADDTGLEVESLNGAPGVFSARYAGKDGNSEKNIEKLLNNLKNNSNRIAQFKTVIALNLSDKQYLFEGICKGTIIEEKCGNKGFGYDPIFIPDGYSKTFAEMNIEEKGKISHRGKAIQQLIYFLKNI
jgi:XTP/dITP diphosphohydrolase